MTTASGKPVRTHDVVVVRGDGIGPELVDAALLVLAAVEQRTGDFNLAIDFREGGAELYRREGFNLAAETVEAIKRADAAMKGPVGLPEVRLPDGTEARWSARRGAAHPAGYLCE